MGNKVEVKLSVLLDIFVPKWSTWGLIAYKRLEQVDYVNIEEKHYLNIVLKAV